jgi:hypothetical protein
MVSPSPFDAQRPKSGVERIVRVSDEAVDHEQTPYFESQLFGEIWEAVEGSKKRWGSRVSCRTAGT